MAKARIFGRANVDSQTQWFVQHNYHSHPSTCMTHIVSVAKIIATYAYNRKIILCFNRSQVKSKPATTNTQLHHGGVNSVFAYCELCGRPPPGNYCHFALSPASLYQTICAYYSVKCMVCFGVAKVGSPCDGF